jgi:hypothetical protein
MVDIEEIQKDIITALKPLGLDKVILFGSHMLMELLTLTATLTFML